jgi:hypothetical protein
MGKAHKGMDTESMVSGLSRGGEHSSQPGRLECVCVWGGVFKQEGVGHQGLSASGSS